LDGAHNPDGAQVLATWLKRVLQRRPLAMVVGLSGGRDPVTFLAPFRGLVKALWAVPVQGAQCTPPADIARAAVALGATAVASDLPSALAAAKQWASTQGGAVCIAGSLYLAGEVLGLPER
jgi:dihydrofolate synthase/folylpolyglutamate synthase